LTVLGAYGLTEHLCVAMHRPDSYRFDSAGMPMPGTDLRISDTGEIQLRRSALTFSGYQHNAAETRAAFTSDGAWLRTGDLGFVDAEGRLHVTGREKELIALSGGKKVAPVPIERRLSESPWIAQAVLFGENRRYISALIALRRDYVEKWARETGRGHGFDALLLDPEITERVQHAIDAVNQTLSRPEQIKRFALLPAELSMEGEELTPTLKVRRSVIAQKYQEQLESLYR
jgi:long-chain acyl-CoA synthetase